MNTITDTTTTTAPAATSAPARRRGAKRFTVLAVLLASLFGGLVANSSPASAVAAGNVTFCLKYAGGAPYAGKPVYLYKASSGAASWGPVFKTGTTNAAGCATWRSVPTGYSYATQGYWTYAVGSAGYYYNGWTGAAYLGTNGGTVTQATGTVVGPYRLY